MTALPQVTMGIISEHGWVVPAGLESTACLVNFRISKVTNSGTFLMDSTFASPGRYMAEMLQRLRASAPSESYVIVNPRFQATTQSASRILFSVLENVSACDEDYLLFEDRNGNMAALWIRAKLGELDELAKLTLSALSALDAQLDHDFLEALFGWEGRRIALSSLNLGEPWANGYCRHTFDQAAATLPARLSLMAMSEALKTASGLESARRSLAQIAVGPYHAGDVLFLSQAVTALPQVTALLIHPNYEPIAREVADERKVVPVAFVLPNVMHGPVANEMAHLAEVVELARQQNPALNGVFHLLRQQRDYAASHFHLRDAFWFALGGGEGSCESSWRQAKKRPLATPSLAKKPLVVVHFDGGWKVKSYPRSYRQALVSQLAAAGFAVTILGETDPSLSGCSFSAFKSLEEYKRLLGNAAGLIGVDSFPAHYAAHIGVSTVHLFASTHPRNSQPPQTERSMTVQRLLPCVPCGQITACKLDGGEECRAASPPYEVVRAFLGTLHRKNRGKERHESEAHVLHSH